MNKRSQERLRRLKIGLNDDEIENYTRVLETLTEVDGLPPYQVLDEIGTLIVGLYSFNINALPYLRAMFPCYEWTFRDRELGEIQPTWEENFKDLITSADYFWRASKYDTNPTVTARKKKLEIPGRVFGNGFLDENYSGDTLQLLKTLKILEIWPNSARGFTHLFHEN